jgi:hypothetical protein
VDAKEYRGKARKLRELAEAVQDLSARAELLIVASRYDKLAGQADAQEGQARETVAPKEKPRREGGEVRGEGTKVRSGLVTELVPSRARAHSVVRTSDFVSTIT